MIHEAGPAAIGGSNVKQLYLSLRQCRPVLSIALPRKDVDQHTTASIMLNSMQWVRPRSNWRSTWL